MILKPVTTSVVADCHITSMTVGKPFKTSHESVVLGTSNGQVLYYRPALARVHTHPHERDVQESSDAEVASAKSSYDTMNAHANADVHLSRHAVPSKHSNAIAHNQKVNKVEIKGGCLSHVLAHNLFEFGEVNIVTGDTDGVLSVLSDNRLFRQKCLHDGSSVVAVCVDTDVYTGTDKPRFNSIVAADSTGTITGLGSIFDTLWRIKLSHHITYTDRMNSGIRAMTSLSMLDEYGVRTHVLVVADGEENLHCISDGKLVCSVKINEPVVAMETGWFLNIDASRGESHTQQLLFVDEAGDAFVLHRFKVHAYARHVNAVTHIQRIPLMAMGSAVDGAVMVGRWNTIKVFLDKEMVQDIPTSNWVNGVCLGEFAVDSISPHPADDPALRGPSARPLHVVTSQSDGTVSIFSVEQYPSPCIPQT
ncbi:hypothetical protein SARC_05601 [Sphaeroforma arctica JP610]|uniref:Cleavage/polyadenylation specificity factor A subunit N-terminal domain-containing protein n=1 Tax=Sphaeroforma arctica JP610 TaxID=667725 RepID=A0A0L0FZ64_9EUKA|nr:hypothetical protein SARC_05601 [Sphaeroforma arctica JP610]KNC82112.1 hypothetical protein SARC_05601 [Sphaeroforma arctica JP610]|eukprot:XP_014156014.1 hypothetical protein SARC_05601 [Sphaeroforma arctica JP610]